MKQFQREREEYAKKMAEANAALKERSEADERLKTTPQIRNINQDETMSGMQKFAFNEGDNYIGKKNADFTPHVKLSGVGIANK